VVTVAYIVVSAVIAAIAIASASAKLARHPRIVESLDALGVPQRLFPQLAALEIAGAIGVVVGFAVRPIGIAAAIGLTLYFVGAVLTHVRANDPHWQPPLVLAVVAGAAAVLAVVA
jgi:uncharacterized membrane protein YphA (DoxX/SURF4 family)